MKRVKLLPFNMVEIALALAVVGIGICGVMALFPVGFNSIRDAMAESYGADISEEFLGQISRVCKANWATWIDADDNVGNIRKTAPTDMTTNPVIIKGAPLVGDIYYTDKTDIFLIERKTGGILDFEAHMQISKSPISNLNVAGQNVNFSTMSPPNKYGYGAVLFVTISWPISKPYAAREKRTYCKEVFRQL